jgi:hypothetical protein
MITYAMSTGVDILKSVFDSFKTVSNLQLAQLFVFLVPIYKLTYHYFYDPQPGNLGHQVIQKVSTFDFDSWDRLNSLNVQVFSYLQYGKYYIKHYYCAILLILFSFYWFINSKFGSYYKIFFKKGN